jgi:hypothetical protein
MSTIVLTFFSPSAASRADLGILNEGMALISSADGILESAIAISGLNWSMITDYT